MTERIDFHPRVKSERKKMKQRTLLLIAALFVTGICAAQAQAQASRTFAVC